MPNRSAKKGVPATKDLDYFLYAQVLQPELRAGWQMQTAMATERGLLSRDIPDLGAVRSSQIAQSAPSYTGTNREAGRPETGQEFRVEDEQPAPGRFAVPQSLRLPDRFLEMLPGLLTWLLVTAPLWAGFFLPLPFALAVVAFDIFWLYLSVSTAWGALKGYAQIHKATREDWPRRYRAARIFNRAYLDWDDIRHIVIIPNYKEPFEILRRTLRSLAVQELAASIIVVLAMESREPRAEEKAVLLQEEFGGQFAGILVSVHPAGLPGEVVGKSSNEAWAGRMVKRVLVDERGFDLQTLTVTSCDADTIFHPRYFSCLSYEFATNPNRYRRFWQSPILLTNNVWEVPAPLRVGGAMAGVHILSNLMKKNRMIFPQSTYSLSLKMADDVGYWDEDVIPEDWHMFLKCFFSFSGQVEVEPIFLPTGNDGVKAKSYLRSLQMAYIQHKRHAWGASDIPYTIRQCVAHDEIPAGRKLRRLLALSANHLLWSTHWFLLSLGWMLPLALANVVGIRLVPEWLPSLARIILALCSAPYVLMIAIDSRLRPEPPDGWGKRNSAVAFVYWWLIPFTSFLFSTVPALESQTRLMLGKRLEYRVTEKA
ncbi:MAG: glycosyltransferase family 2 protein [Dehalococcoidia bacterium]